MYEMEITEGRTDSYSEAAIRTPYELGESRLGFGIIMTTAALIGVWGITCLVNGLSQAGTLQELGNHILMALTGI
ncbi:MAG: hypothetical protein A2521_03310 [Deltaproteobacteria bacterium RIFOXYD12_FULL_57_12]|nr:MAG: hypothetical protein A2521_03310 [Deltaproteobacteria bacterium RIFOXYD12_FULL_57_12]